MLFLSCFALGSLVVFQPVLNRMVMEERGLSIAGLINATVLLLLASGLFLLVALVPEKFPDIIQFKSNGTWHWWYVLPGIIGLFLVMLVPLMISSLGAFPTVLAMLVGQLVTSFLWDSIVNHQSLFSSRTLGLVLAVAGAYLSFRPSS